MSRQDQQRQSDLDQSQVDLGQLLVSVKKQIRLKLDIHLPATVLAYDPITEKAQVTIGWLEIVRDLQIPSANAELPLPPKVVTCRVGWIDNGAGDGSRFPIAPGTTGSVSTYDRDLNTWLLAPPGTPVDPLFSWNHLLKDSIFEPNLRPNTVPVVPIVGPALVAHVISAAAILMLGGQTAVEPVTQATKLGTFLATAATTAAAAAIPTDGGVAAFTSFATTMAGLVAAAGSTKVLSE